MPRWQLQEPGEFLPDRWVFKNPLNFNFLRKKFFFHGSEANWILCLCHSSLKFQLDSEKEFFQQWKSFFWKAAKSSAWKNIRWRHSCFSWRRWRWLKLQRAKRRFQKTRVQIPILTSEINAFKLRRTTFNCVFEILIEARGKPKTKASSGKGGGDTTGVLYLQV